MDQQTVHAIPADFESTLGHDPAATSQAAQSAGRVESNVTAPSPGTTPGESVPDDDVSEFAWRRDPEIAVAPTDAAETR